MEMTQAHTATTLSLSLIDQLPFGNSRKKRNSEKFAALCQSIKAKGVIQSVVVRPSNDRYELIAGYGRFEASKLAGLTDIPAIIAEVDDAKALELQMEENLNREDLSLLDEAKAAQELCAYYSGDRQAIATRLCWSVKRVNERLELMKCTDEVLDALDNGTITVGHALVLAPFSEKVQQVTLQKVVAEKWTVSYLKERANKAQQYLQTAKFKTTECNNCPHNNAHQSGLFDIGDHKAACSNIQCFRAKTQEWLEERKAELSEQYGQIFFLNEINSADRNTVSADTVGEEQFSQGCAACDKRVVLMDDHLGRTLGSTYENQCIDKVCYTKCTKALTAVEADEAQSLDTTTTSTTDVGQVTKADGIKLATTTSSTKAKKAPTVGVTPKKVTEQNDSLLRGFAAQNLTGKSNFTGAMLIASLLRSASGYKSDNSDLSSSMTFDCVVGKAMAFSATEVKAEIESIIKFMATTASDSATSINFTRVMKAAFRTVEGAKDTIKQSWTPTKQILETYTSAALVAMCKESGFDAVIESKEKGKFTKLSNGKKSDLVAAMLAKPEVWTDFAPSDLLKQL